MAGQESFIPRRVVVTGIGAISSLASSARESWNRVLNGETGIRRAANLDPAMHKCLLRSDVDDSNIPQRFLNGKALRNASRYARMAVEAAGEALMDAGLLNDDLRPKIDLTDAGAALGNCIGGTYDDMIPAHDVAVKRNSYGGGSLR